MEYIESIVEDVGDTPLVRVDDVVGDVPPIVLAKLENRNPGGSMKDRIARRMIERAEEAGDLDTGGTIIEPTSGNTGIALATVAAVKGYECILTVPDAGNEEKVRHMRALGAEVVLCPPDVPVGSPDRYNNVAERLHEETPNSVLLDQYDNPANPEAHYATTGREVWAATDGRITHFVCAMGTGGTITGVGRYLKEHDETVQVVGVDAVGSALTDHFHGRPPEQGDWAVEGLGCGRLPGALDFDVVDDVRRVEDGDAFRTTRDLAREAGVLVGGSSGAVLGTARDLATDLTAEDVVVCLFADTGERYLFKEHDPEWIHEHGYGTHT